MNKCLTLTALEVANANNYKLLDSIPKGDRHAHMALSAPFSTFERLSFGQAKAPPKHFHNYQEFNSYIKTNIAPLLSSRENNRNIFSDSLDAMIASGVTYTEMSFDFRLAKITNTPWVELTSDWQQEIQQRQGQITVSPEFGIARETDLALWKSEFAPAIDTGFFDGIDLYGEELARPIESFQDLLEEARRAKMRIKLHSGESGDAQRVRHELEFASPDGIQHGIMASHDSELLMELACRRIPVNVCPWSNICLSLAASYQKHPIKQMFEAGVNVTIASDDFSIFSKSLSAEYVELFSKKVFTIRELEAIRLNSLKR